MPAVQKRQVPPLLHIVQIKGEAPNWPRGPRIIKAVSTYTMGGKEISWNEFKLHSPRKEYSETANRRFSLLDRDYFAKKALEDRFPLEGNVRLAKAIVKNLPEERGREIVLLDIGAAGGALSTLCLLQRMFEHGMTNVKVMLNDISAEALKATKEWDFILPTRLLQRKYGWDMRFFDFARKALSNAEVAVGNMLEIGALLPKADVVYSGFTHHHMNIYDKEESVKMMEFLAKSGAIIGIVDECMAPKDYLRWINMHANETNSRGEPVPIALESFISLEQHACFLESSRLLASGKARHYYYFVARKL